MRGQRLFTRPIGPEDAGEIERFLRAQHPSATTPPKAGLIGKLVGDLVAVAGVTVAGDALMLDLLVVDASLRRKRIGRFMLEELERYGRTQNRRRIVVMSGSEGHAFFTHVGFAPLDGALTRLIPPP